MDDGRLVLGGALAAALLALCADVALGRIEHALAPASLARRDRRRWWWAAAALALAAAVLGAWTAGRAGPARPVVVGSKDFTEQVILGELLAQAIEARGVPVERRFELAGDLCHRGLVAGEIDAYVEYTGTAYTAYLHHAPITDPAEVYKQASAEYRERFHAAWGAPLGLDNTFAILVRQGDARRLGLRTISDAARYATGWRAAFGQDFMSRPDGYAGFARAYGLAFAEPPREMDLALTYRALAAGQVDLIAGNSTDGMIDRLGLVRLEDDRRYFPPYQAAPVVRLEALARHPEIRAAIDALAGRLSDAEMRRLNYAADVEHRDPAQLVRDLLARAPL
jgi:osmoprotectant transport system permease protein